jgi:hypothetical protein
MKLLSNLLPIPIKGKITDDAGKPVVGANVLEKGTNNGVTTDKQGSYSIQVKDENSVLVVTYVGYAAQEITVGSQTSIDIKFESESKKLEDVVVVGYGTQKRSELTNAVVQTTGKEITKSNAVSVV